MGLFFDKNEWPFILPLSHLEAFKLIVEGYYVSILGELIGTALLIVLGGGVCAGVSLKKSFAKDSGWIVITMGWGLAVAVAAYAVGSISGAHLNPALTIGLAFKERSHGVTYLVISRDK